MSKLQVLESIDLTDDEKDLAAMLINLFGDGMHPYADKENLGYFTTSYMQRIIESEDFKATKEKQTSKIMTIFNTLEPKLY